MGEEEAAHGERVVPTALTFSSEGGGWSGEGRSGEWVARRRMGGLYAFSVGEIFVARSGPYFEILGACSR
jgi:hypothetical protein